MHAAKPASAGSDATLRAVLRGATSRGQRGVGAARARGRTMLLTALAFGLLVVAFAQSRWLPLALLFVVGIGLSDAAYATLNGTLVQTTVDDAYRGRVMALYSLLWGLTPIGSLEEGRVGVALRRPDDADDQRGDRRGVRGDNGAGETAPVASEVRSENGGSPKA